MSEISEYYDNFLAHLKKDHERENPRHVHIKKRIDQLVKPGMDVLDFGCGTGLTTKYIAEKEVEHVWGIDLSEKLIEYAKENSDNLSLNYWAGDILDISLWELLGGVQDIIFMNDVLEHIPKEKAPTYLEHISYILTKDGIFYVNIPYGPYQQWIGNNKPYLQQIVDETYYVEELCELFGKIKFVPTMINIYGIDTECQYLEAVFSRTSNVFNYYKSRFNG